MRLLSLLPLLAPTLVTSLTLPRQASAPTLLASPGGWLGSLAARSNGALLATRVDTPQLWTIDPTTGSSTKLLDFPNALGLTGIAEVAPDVFVVLAGNVDTAALDTGDGSWAVWKVNLTGSTPVSTFVTGVPQAGFLLGATPLANNTALLADAAHGAIYRLDLSTGTYSVALQDAALQPPSGAPIAEGVHGVHFVGATSTLFFSNTLGGSFSKVGIDAATGKPTGAITPITATNGVPAPEEFALIQGTAFVVSHDGNAVYKVGADGAAVKIFDVKGATGIVVGRGAADAKTLYVGTSDGKIWAAASPAA